MLMTIEVTDLPGRLKELLRIVETGTEVLLRDGDSTAKLATTLAVRTPLEPRIGNLHAGCATMSPNFDEPMPDEFWGGPIEP